MKMLEFDVLLTETVLMVTLGLSIAQREGTIVVEWKSAETKYGAQCVMMHGTTQMPVWHVDSWDSPDTVCYK